MLKWLRLLLVNSLCLEKAQVGTDDQHRWSGPEGLQMESGLTISQNYEIWRSHMRIKFSWGEETATTKNKLILGIIKMLSVRCWGHSTCWAKGLHLCQNRTHTYACNRKYPQCTEAIGCCSLQPIKQPAQENCHVALWL